METEQLVDLIGLRSILLLGGLEPRVSRVPPERITFRSVVAAGAAEPSGEEVRRAFETSRHDRLVVVRDAAGLPEDWLWQALMLLEDPLTASVVVGPDGRGDDEVIAVPGSATVFRSEALREIGGFWWPFDNEGFEEDAQWRLVSRGYRVERIAAPGAAERSLASSTRLALLTNNLGQEALERLLPLAVMAAVAGPLRTAGVDTDVLDLQRSPGGDDIGTLSIPRDALEGVRQLDAYGDLLPDVAATRRETQQSRRLSDHVLAGPISAFLEDTWSQLGGIPPEAEAAFGRGFESREPLHALMIGPGAPDAGAGISEWETEVATHLRVSVTHLSASTGKVHEWADGAWNPVIGSTESVRSCADLIILEGVYIRAVPWVSAVSTPILVDCTHWPFEEDLRSEHSGLTSRPDDHGVHAHLLAETLARADKILTSTESRRDFLLGHLSGIKRVNPLVYDEDHSLRSLVDTLSAEDWSALTDWCARPARAVDLVRSFEKTVEPIGRVRKAGHRVRSLAKRLSPNQE